MPQDVEIPLSALNNVPGVTGIEDVGFTVPTLDEIVDDITDELPVLEDIEDVVTQAIDDLDTTFGLTQDALDDIVDSVQDDIQDGLDIPDLDPSSIADDIADQLDIPDIGDIPDVGQGLDQAVADLEDVIQDTVPEADDIVTDVVNDLRADLDQLAPEVDNLAQAVAREVDVVGDGGVSVDVSGFFGPTGRDLVEGFGGVLQGLLDPDDGGIPSLGDVRRIVTEEVVALLEDQPGGDIILDPVQFFQDLIVDILEDQLGPETEQALQELQDRDE
jgi:hypothetical protein